MRAATRKQIQSALARAKYRRENSLAEFLTFPVAAEIASDDRFTQDRWYTFAEIARRFKLSHDKISRDFRGRPGVAQFGSDYRVSEGALRAWLAEALANQRNRRTA